MMKRKVLFIAIVAISFLMLGIMPAQANNNTNKIVNALNEHLNDLYKKVSPAVVIIVTKKLVPAPTPAPAPAPAVKHNPNINKINMDDANKKSLNSLGSGFFYDKSGIIITNSHVVHDSVKITVYLKDDRKFEARLIGDDPVSDIAIIKIDGKKDFPVLKLGSSKKIKVGHMIFALGVPFGLKWTFTQGIISAKRSNMPINPYGNYLQVTAAINHGNSGGPLLNISGEVVGINTFIIPESHGLAFSISIDYAKDIIKRLLRDKKIIRAFIGASVRNLSEDEKKSLNKVLEKNNHRGIYVESTTPNFPASLGGLKGGDIIIRVNNQTINSIKQFVLFVSYLDIGEDMKTYIVRDGTRALITLKPIKHPKF